jgi:biotin operon repressor
MGWHPTMDKIINLLRDGRPRSSREIAQATGLSREAVWGGPKRLLEEGDYSKDREAHL